MANLTCEGNCEFDNEEGHQGEVKEVLVSGNWLLKPIKFNYCQAAIDEDIRRGFNVELA